MVLTLTFPFPPLEFQEKALTETTAHITLVLIPKKYAKLILCFSMMIFFPTVDVFQVISLG